MHLLNMPQIYQEQLNRPNTALISYKVLMYVKGYKIETQIGGQIQYDTTETENHCFDVSKAVKNDKIVINKSIPELPTFDGEGSIGQYSNITLQLQKVYSDFWQYVGQGAGITDLQQSSVEIYAVCDNMPNLLVFKGKVRTAPEEQYEDVTFEVRASMWDIVGKELLTNQYNTQAYTIYGSGVLTEVTNSYIGVTTPTQRIAYHHPLITFNELGQSKTLVTASDSSAADLLSVAVTSDKTARLGKYSIKWLNASSFEFTTPTNKLILITHPTITASGALGITFNAAQQEATGLISLTLYINNPVTPNPFNDIMGKTIDFWLSFTVQGNPISIVRDLIIRSITGDWNTAGAVIENPILPINYQVLSEMETLFDFITIYVSEWNESNDVYSYKNNSKPIQAKNIIQKCLDHIGCQLTYDSEGKISINSNWFYINPIKLWRLGSIHCGAAGSSFTPSHSIKSETEYQRMELFYAYNPMTKNAAGKIVEIKPTALVGIYGVNDKPKSYTVTLPYYKLGVSDLLVEAIGKYLWKWVQLSHIRLSANVLPQFGLTLDVGDKFIADFKTSPILPNIDKGIGKYFMIYSISKGIGKEVGIECIAIPEPILPSHWCDAYWCAPNSRWR